MRSLKHKFASVAQSTGLGERQIKVIASDATPDRDGDILDPAGCDLTSYKSNPVVLADHDPTKPIGTASAAYRNGKIEATITFAPAGASAKADEYCALAKAGVLKGVSVGFLPTGRAEVINGGGFRYAKWTLAEISVVAVPSNPSALVVEKAARGARGGAAARARMNEALALKMAGNAMAARLDPAAFERSTQNARQDRITTARRLAGKNAQWIDGETHADYCARMRRNIEGK